MSEVDSFVHKLHHLREKGSTQITVDIDYLLGVLNNHTQPQPVAADPAQGVLGIDGGQFS